MNKNYEKLVQYFVENGAIEENKAISLDDFHIKGVAQDELEKLVDFMKNDFHRTTDNKFWYKKTTFKIHLSLSDVVKWLIGVVIAAVIISLIKIYVGF